MFKSCILGFEENLRSIFLVIFFNEFYKELFLRMIYILILKIFFFLL